MSIKPLPAALILITINQKQYEKINWDFSGNLFLFSWHTNFYFNLWHDYYFLCNKGVNHLHLREAQGQSGQQIVSLDPCIFVAHQTLKRHKLTWSF